MAGPKLLLVPKIRRLSVDDGVSPTSCSVRAGLEAEPAELRKSDQTAEFAQRLANATRRHNPEHLWLLARALRANGQPAAAVDVATHARLG
jgi:hypothetical protein